MLFYAIGDKLYYTPVGKPWAWPEEYFIDFPTDITGIGVVNSGLLIFTAIRTYIITGNSPSTLSRYPLGGKQGCRLHASIQKINDFLIWVSNDGLCASSGGSPKVISRDKLGDLDLDPIVAVVYKDVYYLLHSTGLLAYDVRFGPVYKNLTLGCSYLLEGNDTLYGLYSDGYYELFAGEDSLQFYYLSPVFLDGAYTNRKSYNKIYIRSEGALTLAIYINSALVQTWQLTTTDTHMLDVPQIYKNGYSIQFEIYGTGKVFELDYSPYGRAN